MSEEKDNQTNAPPPSPAPSSSGVSSMTIATLAAGVLGVLGSAAGAGWPGVVALVLLGMIIPFGWGVLVRELNKWSDKRDMNRAGSDVGQTALNLEIQGREVSRGLEQVEASDEPTEGFKKN